MRILVMYATLMPVVIAGAANMLFTKSALYRSHNAPIDGGKLFSDKKRIFGDNKTWAGFFGMILAACLSQLVWGLLSECIIPLGETNELYRNHGNSPIFNAIAGTLFGLAYVLCELPNSFIKRRIDIPSGKTAGGIKGAVFFLIDQIDSLLGVVLVLAMFTHITFAQYIQYIILGAFTHIALNFILLKLKIRKNI